MIGHGHFAQIFECIGRLDGIKYAIKDGGRQVSDTALEVQSLHEVFAHSVLGKLIELKLKMPFKIKKSPHVHFSTGKIAKLLNQLQRVLKFATCFKTIV